MSRYGDTPAGMVEATMEFLRICQSERFNNVVVSLKSSNTRIMVQAYRLLALQMQKEEMAYALHLGVTEAGSGEDGRIKSAVGMGTLMHDGLGDTIRVSLTEHPAKEIPVAAALVNHFKTLSIPQVLPTVIPAYNPFTYQKRKSANQGIIGGSSLPVVVSDLTTEAEITPEIIEGLGFVLNPISNQFERTDLSPDALYVGELEIPFRFGKNALLVSDHKYWDNQSTSVPLFSWEEYLFATQKSFIQNWVQIHYNQLDEKTMATIKEDPTLVLVVYSYSANKTQEIRTFINQLLANQITNPVIIQQAYSEFHFSDFQLKSAADCGLFFIDGLSDGIWLKNTFKKSNKEITDTAFGILQASRTRTSKTEYISCPSCGRTLFDLEVSLAEVKEATSHLRGLKIAIMGCIVNGPGEMADADYGYVGAGPGKVSLYKGKELVLRNIDAKDAVKELIKLIDQDSSVNQK
jgi:(E)-4-hydroxy-3-methylbut-2-enyl-diphosphate synthase